MWKLFKRKRHIALEDQLANLAEYGIRLRPGISVEHLLASFERKKYEGDPYSLLLTMMGGTTETNPPQPLSDNILYLDTECICDTGDYARIAERMRALAGGDLPLEDLKDHVDLEAGEAWLEFSLDGKRMHWKAEVNDDWFDPTVASRFAELLTQRGVGKRYTYCNLEGQDCLIGCSTREQLRLLCEETGMPFVWLT